MPAAIEADKGPRDLDRDQARLLLGWLVYAIVWILVLEVILTAINVDETASAILALTTTMTGVSGHSVASKAKSAALKAFDRAYPPSDQPRARSEEAADSLEDVLEEAIEQLERSGASPNIREQRTASQFRYRAFQPVLLCVWDVWRAFPDQR